MCKDLEDILTHDEIDLLRAAWPGQRLYIPSGEATERKGLIRKRLELLLGEASAALLVQERGGDYIEIPALNKEKEKDDTGRELYPKAVRILANNGFSRRQIAGLVGLCERTVTRLMSVS